METTTTAPLPRDDRMNLAENMIAGVIAGGLFVGSIAFNIYPVVASDVVRNLGLNSSESGLLMSAFLLGYGIAAIPAGALSAAYSSRAVLLSALGLMTVGFLLFSAADQFAVMLLSRILMGLGSASIVPAANHLASELFSGHKLLRAVGVFGAGWGVGNLFAFLALGFVFASGGWRVTMQGAALVGVLIMLAMALPLRGKGRGRGRGVEGREPAAVSLRVDWLRHIVANRPLALLTLLNLAGMSTMVGMVTWAPAYLQSAFASDVFVSNVYTGLAGVAMVVASYLGGPLGVKYGSKTIIVVSALACAAIPTLAAVAAFEAVIVALIILTGFFTLLNFGPIFATVARVVPPSLTGTATGYVAAVSLGGSLVSPYFFGLALDLTGLYWLGFAILAVIALVGLVASLALPSDA